MDRIVEKNLLYDFYGEFLTDHQKAIYEEAVYNDLSLSELSEAYNISRQGVHDLLKRCDKILDDYEEKLHLVEKFEKIKDVNEEIIRICSSDDVNVERILQLSEEVLTII